MPVSTGNIEEASGGNQALRNILQQYAAAIAVQQKATATSAVLAPQQQPATVAFENPLFVVTFTSQQPATTQQAAQQAALGSAAGGKNIYNQVRVATSLLFDAASSVALYGGDNGSPQSQFVITDLDITLGWYFQVRSSYDGNTWNQWKTINGGKPVNPNASGVSVQPVTGGAYAMFLLPGSTAAGFGVSETSDQQTVFPGPGTSIKNAFGISAPQSFVDAGKHAIGLNGSISSEGVVTEEYVDSSGNKWPATANVLLFSWGTSGQTPLIVDVAGGTFAVFILPGGNLFAIGSGVTADGGTFALPPGFSNANAMAIPSPASATSTSNTAHGVATASITPTGGTTATMTVAMKWGDGDTGSEGATWSGDAQWLCLAWSPALQPKVVAVTGGQYIVLETPSGQVALGMGTTTSGDTIPLPSADYAWQDDTGAVQALGFVTPNSTSGSGGNDLHGIQLCSVNAQGQAILTYADGSGNQWTGGLNWFAIAWQNPQS